ncbi:MAG: RICIN domain-containing protein [Coriobacteriales bacterium]|jgi:peptidoglycan/xylan/chitin deacetylase (PgdA/CDA1 family)|nr:RICIN domain-containing protein [Coriobacteriales bacterium]
MGTNTGINTGPTKSTPITRRSFIGAATTAATIVGLSQLLPSVALAEELADGLAGAPGTAAPDGAATPATPAAPAASPSGSPSEGSAARDGLAEAEDTALSPADTGAYKPRRPVVPATGDYVITSSLAGAFVVDVPGAQRSTGLQLQLYAANKTFAQIFHISSTGDYCTIHSLATGLTMSVSGDKRTAKTPVVQQRGKRGLLSQKWVLEDNGDGSVSFISAASGLALEVAGSRAKNGALLYVRERSRRGAQRFELARAEARIIPDGSIVSLIPYSAPTRVVGIAAASRKSGATAQLQTSDESVAQKFEVNYHGKNIYSFAALCSGRLLSVERGRVLQRPQRAKGPSPSQLWKAEYTLGGMTLTNQGDKRRLARRGAALVTSPATRSSAQYFSYNIVPPVAAGTYTLVEKSGLALDISGASLKNGAAVQLYYANGTNAQKFELETHVTGPGANYVGAVVRRLAGPRAALTSAISIENCNSDKAVTLARPGASSATSAQQRSFKGSLGQLFVPVPSKDGYFHLRSALAPTAYLGAAKTVSGARVYTTTSSARALRFSFRPTKYTPSASKWIAITFDDGPSAYTGGLLDELKKRDVHATFFVVGSFVQSEAGFSLVQRMADEGHEVGNHTWAHDGTPGALMSGLKGTDDIVTAATGKPCALMRPPGGGVNEQTMKCGKPIILWSIDPRDWENRNPEYIYSYVVDNAKSGDIVLLHDSHNTTIPAALRIIDTLKARGYAFATVSQLLGDPKPNVVYRSGPATVGSLR